MKKKIARVMSYVWLVGSVAVLCGYQIPLRVIAAAACLALAGINRIESERQEALERAERERDTLAAQGMSRADSRRAFKEAIKGETPE